MWEKYSLYQKRDPQSDFPVLLSPELKCGAKFFVFVGEILEVVEYLSCGFLVNINNTW
jgi:hypothetical protein